jgi:hypothetical protein
VQAQLLRGRYQASIPVLIHRRPPRFVCLRLLWRNPDRCPVLRRPTIGLSCYVALIQLGLCASVRSALCRICTFSGPPGKAGGGSRSFKGLSDPHSVGSALCRNLRGR